ncbi:VCBS repeat-containing protein [Streptomyces sp. NPDC046324]|uniref:FG-GAP repeat domain-containing protein n=1 Tax=Streptomyces sp. NPDC046324 TaxID=3154915 RepID=UPI0033D97CEE
MNHRISRRRLATTVLAVSTVTAVAGTLLAAPTALASPAALPPAAARQASADVVAPFPLSATVLSAGLTGYLASTPNPSSYTWTRYADGTVTTLPGNASTTYAGVAESDIVVESEGTRHLVHDMAKGGDPVLIDSPYALERVNGSTLVMRDAATGELHLVSRAAGGEIVDRKVAGLAPSGDVTVFPTTPGTVAVQTVADDPRAHRLDLVDVATATVVETYDLPTSASRVQIGPDHLVWAASYTTSTLVDRKTKKQQSLPYAAYLALGGDWLAIRGAGAVDGVTYPDKPIILRSLKDGRTVPLLDYARDVTPVADGTLLVEGGTFAQGRGLFRVSLDANGTPVATMVGDSDQRLELVLEWLDVPSVYRFPGYGSGERELVTYGFNQESAGVRMEVTHTATGRRGSFHDHMYDHVDWNGYLDNALLAYNGAYTWKLTATPHDGFGPDVVRTGTFTVARGTTPRDFTDNASSDVLVRDSAGNLSAYDVRQLRGMRDDECYEEFCLPVVHKPDADVLGTGWNTYTLMASPGNLAGSSAHDVVGRDRDGVLWLHQSDKQKLLPRTKVGGGWNIYKKLVGGSDLDGDGRSDLLATDTSGVLWLYRSTGNAKAPFSARKRIGSGWGIYNLLTAPGNIAGARSGDLLARDASGTLWLYLGKGDGTFTSRRKIGGGWQKYHHVVPAGVDTRGLADLYAIGPSGSAHYSPTGDTTRPFRKADILPLRSDSTTYKTFF